jgi:AcrR family transcriptional regulator
LREDDVRHLPLLNQPVAERADAARNRRKILDAAERLLVGPGAEAVPTSAVAAAAGVGTGTLFRRFGSREGLMNALFEQRAIDLQTEVLSGPPPLGPGAPAGERLRAFLRAVHGFVDRYSALVTAYEHAAPGARYRAPVYRFWHQHVQILLAQVRPDLDADPIAHALLAPLTAEQQTHLAGCGTGADRRAAAVDALAAALIDGSPRGT